MSFELALADCVGPLGAELLGGNVTVHGVSIDTRTLKPGELYVAIKGDRFDGHDFVTAAEQAGAAAVMVQSDLDSSLPQLKVPDTQLALGQLGRFWAGRFGVPTIAITGSNGKTTVKEIIASILRQIGPVLATKGNLNNELGVPLTLLGMRKEHIYAVIEMGANHSGEIARLAALVEPDVALITNIGSAHIEGFGSVEGIAAAKCEIYAALRADGYGVINSDDKFADVMRQACSHCNVQEFGRTDRANVQGLANAELAIDSMGYTITPRFRLAGEHNVANALAAVAAVQCLGVQKESIVKGLESVVPAPGRLEKKSGSNGSVIVDDSYNANPDSVRSAIRVLAAYRGKRYLVLGDMAELGVDAEAMHRDIGQFARELRLDGLWSVGDLSVATHVAFRESGAQTAPLAGNHFISRETLIADLQHHLDRDVTVLVKGSRSAGMELVVSALVEKSRSNTGAPIAGGRS